MGTGAASGGAGGSAITKSLRDKINETASSLVKVASRAMDGLRAAFAKVTAKDDKVIVNLPGRANQEIPNKPTNTILAEGVKISDLLKVAAGVALSALFGNPIPLMLARRHVENLSERIKAKEREVKKQAQQNKKIGTRAAQRRLNKNDAEYRQLRALESRMNAKQKEASLAVKRAEIQGSRQVSDIDKKLIDQTSKSFTRLGYSSADAKKAAEIALSKTTNRDVNSVLKLALREVAALQERK